MIESRILKIKLILTSYININSLWHTPLVDLLMKLNVKVLYLNKDSVSVNSTMGGLLCHKVSIVQPLLST